MFRANIELLTRFTQWIDDRKNIDCHRSMIIVSASRGTIKKLCATVIEDTPKSLMLSETIAPAGSFSSPRNINSQLGKEYTNVIFDARHDFSASALYAASGLVEKSGNFILLSPPLHRWSTLSAKYDAQSSYGYTSNENLFVKKLAQTLLASKSVSWLNPKQSQLFPPEMYPQSIELDDAKHTVGKGLLNHQERLALNSDQSAIFNGIVRSLENGISTKHIVLGKRGRGKSTLLAHIGLYASTQNLRIKYTATVKRNCNVITELFNNNIHLHDDTAEFIPPDQAAFDASKCQSTDLLLIDEIASIAPDIVKFILEKYKFVVMAGTYDGYEGSGKGLVQRLIPSINGIVNYELSKPLRWYNGDSIERIFANLFSPQTTRFNTQLNSLQVGLFDKELLITNIKMYEEVVHLLMSAHYQTTPNDIKRILDDKSYQLIVAYKKHNAIKTIVGLMVCVQEGGFTDNDLMTKIAEGKRRVKGQLFAQNMALYAHSPALLEFNYLRVQRIAVIEPLRQQGIGSQLLKFVSTYTMNNEQILCTNFGLTDNLIKFWNNNNFTLVKVGQKVDGASGTLSGFFIHPQLANKAAYPISTLLIKLHLEIAFIKRFKEHIYLKIPSLLKESLNFDLQANKQTDNYLKKSLHLFDIRALRIEQLLPETHYLIKANKRPDLEKNMSKLVKKGISKEVRIKSGIALSNWLKKTRF